MDQAPWPWLPKCTTPAPLSPDNVEAPDVPALSPNSIPNDTEHLPQTPTSPNATSRQIKKKKKKVGRTGAPNYSTEDVENLLDIVEEVLPLGANMWALVGKQYNEWSELNERPTRDMESLKLKFDKLAGHKKDTGDPSCPPEVRKAKHIARDILGKCHAHTAGDTSSGDDKDSFGNTLPKDSDSGEDGGADSHPSCSNANNKKRQDVMPLGARKNKRTPGATGISKRAPKNVVEEQICAMSANIAQITKTYSSRHGPSARQECSEEKGLTREDVKKIVKEEVSEMLAETNRALRELKEMMQGIHKRQ